MGCSLPGSSVHGIFQARILEWVAISYSRGSSQARDRTCVSCISCIGLQILYHCTTWEAQTYLLGEYNSSHKLYLPICHWCIHASNYLSHSLSSPNLPNITVEKKKKKECIRDILACLLQLKKQGQIFSYHKSAINVSFCKKNWLFN